MVKHIRAAAAASVTAVHTASVICVSAFASLDYKYVSKWRPESTYLCKLIISAADENVTQCVTE